jgi:centromeric protein E
MSSERLQVAVRVRGLLGEEEAASGLAWRADDNDGVDEVPDAMSPPAQHAGTLVAEARARQQSTAAFSGRTPFVYDHTFGERSTNKQIYEQVVKFIIEGALDGFNGTVFAYGQTGSGKTFTMIGTPQSPGIVVLALNDIFKDFTSQRRHASKRFLIRCSFLEIYNEMINDLLDPTKKNLKLQDTGHDINVVGLTVSQVESVDDALHLMEDGLKVRATGSTKMNDQSSRSHSIFTIHIEALDSKSGAVKQAQLNLVDLSGSESAKRSGTSGKRLQEGASVRVRMRLYLCARVSTRAAL